MLNLFQTILYFIHLNLANRLPQQCTANNRPNVNIQSGVSYVSSDEIKSSCIVPNQQWELSAQPGQTLNITFRNLKSTHEYTGAIYGIIESESNGDNEVLGSGVKETNTFFTSNAVVIVLQHEPFDADYLIQI